jgi:hypothetical protein
MIKHIVMWKLKDQAEQGSRQENALRMKALLEMCKGLTQGLLKLEVGLDIGTDSAPWDVVLYAEFEDRAALAAYQQHPVHLAAKPFIARVREQRAAVDYEIPGGH